MVQVLLFSEKGLLKYGLLEQLNSKILSFGYVLEFDIYMDSRL